MGFPISVISAILIPQEPKNDLEIFITGTFWYVIPACQQWQKVLILLDVGTYSPLNAHDSNFFINASFDNNLLKWEFSRAKLAILSPPKPDMSKIF